MPAKAFAFLIAMVLVPAITPATADDLPVFEGTLTATLAANGTEAVQLRFTRKQNQLRIEPSGGNASAAVNLVDLASGKLTILFPQYSSFVRVEPTKPRTTPAMPSLAPMPPVPQLPPRPDVPLPSGGLPSSPLIPGSPGAPAMVVIPNMPLPPVSSPELKKTDRIRNILGFDCTCYLVDYRLETFEVWAVPDSAVFPFHLRQLNAETRHFGPPGPGDRLVELMNKAALFPLEAILRSKENRDLDRFTFKVTSVGRQRIGDDLLFAVPKGFAEVAVPRF